MEGDVITVQVSYIHHFQFRAHPELLSEFWVREVTGLFVLHLPSSCQSSSKLGQKLAVLWALALQDFFGDVVMCFPQHYSSLCSYLHFSAISVEGSELRT